ncbi:DNA (cytosine-5)-methyltransferase 1 [Kitasatospora sp. MAA4]|nr:DNA (cytosine-5)-methyltransferase 1 [Kitasatospora sp. MAA4]
MPALSAIDLFAGAGGATQGLRDAGFSVLAAVENDPEAAETYRANHSRVRLFEADVRQISPSTLMKVSGLKAGQLDLLKACPPCQGFSTLASGQIDEQRNDLVLDIARFVKKMKPRAILLENVPGLRRDRRLGQLISKLEAIGYSFIESSLDAASFGVPQRRKRFILVGIRGNRTIDPSAALMDFLPKSFSRNTRTAGQALAQLARFSRPGDPLGITRQPSEAVAARIAAIPIGGGRFDLPTEHQLACHQKVKGRSAASSYGRVKLNEPAPTMTTRCTTPACGRFVHPTENRGLTLREAATFQTFPVGYRFSGNYGAIERQIGNAVPVRMAKGLGLIVAQILATR